MPPKARRIDSELESLPKAKAGFIQPMLLLRAGALPEGVRPQLVWTFSRPTPIMVDLEN